MTGTDNNKGCADCGAPLWTGGFTEPLICGGCAHALMKTGHTLAEILPGAWQDLGKAGDIECEAWDEYHGWGRRA